MKIYTVGGAVRDQLLGLPVQDHDHVVVGASPEDMERLGYQAVGKDFPVFLHPQTHEEYALARTERKVARGYKGFTVRAAPDVTLEQDLERRDLTINAMARDEAGALIDPYGGAADLKAGVLRHVSPAFVEDPVRILRVARFAARFGFNVASETMALMQRMVNEGEADALVPERVWQEFSRGLMEAQPARMFAVLAECGLLPRLLPELDLGAAVMNGLEYAARQVEPLEVRFALLAFAMREAASAEADARALSERLRATNECRDALLLAARHGKAASAASARSDPQALLTLLEAADAFRRPERLRILLSACECAVAGDQGSVQQPYAPRVLLEKLAAAAASIDAAGIARSGGDIGAQVRAARLAALRSALAQS